MCEFVAWFVLAGLIFLFARDSKSVVMVMDLSKFSITTMGVLALSTVVAVGCMWLDITAFTKEDTLAGNVIQSSEMGFAGVINYVWTKGEMVMSNWQISGAVIMILSLVAIGMNKIPEYKMEKFKKWVLRK